MLVKHLWHGRWFGWLLLPAMNLCLAMPPAEMLLQENRPLVIAHRGYSILAPENTLLAFQRALSSGADLIELDYHHTMRQQNLINRVVVQAFDWNYLRDFHRIEPRQILGALGPPGSRDGQRLLEEEKQLSASWLDEMKSFGARVAVWNRQVDASSIKAAHQRGLKVWVYTINEAGLAEELLNHGVDGIITDNPSLIWRVLALRAQN
jgi:glycerophosphoryl diester phosphodiesterase